MKQLFKVIYFNEQIYIGSYVDCLRFVDEHEKSKYCHIRQMTKLEIAEHLNYY